MNREPVDIDQILPYGEQLRGFMAQSFISKSDLKDVLRSRGVFTSDVEKCDTIPLLVATILSPYEFDQLRECQKVREDNPKVITQTIDWQVQDNLLDSVPVKLDVNSILELEFSNFQVTGSPSFVAVEGNPNHIKLDFSVEREDMSKNWATNKSIFQGSLELERVKDGNNVLLVVTHTANETKQVASKVSSNLVQHFKGKGYVNSSKNIEKILFSRFSNPSRIQYLLSLTEKCDSHLLEFMDIVDIEFSPDASNPLPKGISWMERKIEDLKLNGKALHKTFFVKDISYHKALHFYRLDAKFKFEVRGVSGTCVLSLGFPEYSRYTNLNAEMEVNVRTMNFNIPPKGVSKGTIKRALLKEIENQKISNFKRYAISLS